MSHYQLNQSTSDVYAMHEHGWDADCTRCRDTGYAPIKCCDGRDCACGGMVNEIERCRCGQVVPDELQRALDEDGS